MGEALNASRHGEERCEVAVQPLDRLTAPSGVEGSFRWIAAPAKPCSS
jgi:hypothetical protein